jgi:hypothetical protein
MTNNFIEHLIDRSLKKTTLPIKPALTITTIFDMFQMPTNNRQQLYTKLPRYSQNNIINQKQNNPFIDDAQNKHMQQTTPFYPKTQSREIKSSEPVKPSEKQTVNNFIEEKTEHLFQKDSTDVVGVEREKVGVASEVMNHVNQVVDVVEGGSFRSGVDVVGVEREKVVVAFDVTSTHETVMKPRIIGVFDENLPIHNDNIIEPGSESTSIIFNSKKSLSIKSVLPVDTELYKPQVASLESMPPVDTELYKPQVKKEVENTININIGRIEVQAVTEEQAPPVSSSESPILSLSDYLKQYSERNYRE